MVKGKRNNAFISLKPVALIVNDLSLHLADIFHTYTDIFSFMHRAEHNIATFVLLQNVARIFGISDVDQKIIMWVVFLRTILDQPRQKFTPENKSVVVGIE